MLSPGDAAEIAMRKDFPKDKFEARLPPDFRRCSDEESVGASRKTTGVPRLTCSPSARTSQLVNLTQPCDADLLTLSGSAVPWMPYPCADKPIQYAPTGLFGPG
ncbi:hypothetical protein ACVWZK_007453 [Bradyrhizobium sp. GM0.4]